MKTLDRFILFGYNTQNNTKDTYTHNTAKDRQQYLRQDYVFFDFFSIYIAIFKRDNKMTENLNNTNNYFSFPSSAMVYGLYGLSVEEKQIVEGIKNV